MKRDLRGKPNKTRGIVRRILFPGGRRGLGFALAGLIVATTTLYCPAALAFPHYAQIGTTTVYSIEPIPSILRTRIARADRLLLQSPLYEPALQRTIVLTDGGWRWRLMALGHSDAIALRRPFSSMLLFNRSDIVADRMFKGPATPVVRSLSGTIAHESVHVLTARRFGELRLAQMPHWKREGYADYVAREPVIDADHERAIRARAPDAFVLKYLEGRRRVSDALDRKGQSVDQLLGSD